MPTKFRPTAILRHKGNMKVVHSYLKCISVKELRKEIVDGINPKRKAKARKELDRRKIAYEAG